MSVQSAISGQTLKTIDLAVLRKNHSIIKNVDQSLGIRIKCCSFILVMTFQFGLYCIPASLLKDACENSPQAIANCDLVLNGSKYLKACLIIMMQMSQKELSIKAGGIFELNRAAYINMLKSTYSFYTLMNQQLS